MKYLVIAVLVGLVFYLLYRRLRPYIALLRKIIGIASGILETPAEKPKTVTSNKLTRCEACGTWVPENRALTPGPGNAFYCSSKCLDSASSVKRKIAR